MLLVSGIGLDHRDIEWFALETNTDHSVIFESASKYCFSDSLVDHDGYSISSKGFLMNYGQRFMTLYRRQGSRPSPWERNAESKILPGETLQIPVKRREVKSEGEKER